MLRDLFEGWHVVLLVIAFVLLFGARRLPEGARALGRSLRIFKAEVHGLSEDGPEVPQAVTGVAAQPAPQVPAAHVDPVNAASPPVAQVPPAPPAAT